MTFVKQNHLNFGTCYGGILFKEAEVYLSLPFAGISSNYWMFTADHRNEGESGEAAALRAVYSKTGYKAVIISPIDQEWCLSIGQFYYYLMKPVSEFPSFSSPHIQQEWWLKPEMAKQLIQSNIIKEDRKVLLELLDMSVRLWQEWYNKGETFSPASQFDDIK